MRTRSTDHECIYPRCLISDGALGYACVSGRACDPNEMSMSLTAEHKRLQPAIRGDGTVYQVADGDDGNESVTETLDRHLAWAIPASVLMGAVAAWLLYLFCDSCRSIW